MDTIFIDESSILHVSVMEASDDVLLKTIMINNFCIFHIFHLLVHESKFLTWWHLSTDCMKLEQVPHLTHGLLTIHIHAHIWRNFLYFYGIGRERLEIMSQLLFSAKGTINWQPGYRSWYSYSLQARWSRVWNLVGPRLSKLIQISPEAQLSSCTMGTGEKWQGHGIDHPCPYSAKVEYGWTYTSTSPQCLLFMI